MLYQFELKTVGIIVGMALVLAHVVALLMMGPTQEFLKKLPRNKVLGVILIAVASIWAWWIIKTMDLGEFYALREKILIVIPIAFCLVIFFADEFLAVRALGALALLAACVLLNAAWFKEPRTSILLPILAYAWIILGMFWVGMPYLLRDQIDWVTQKASTWKLACASGIGFGLVLFGCALAFY
ncbi:MAG: hypothetical protein AAF514_13930 [Verrucomicrobiota bacterium]